MPCSKLTKNDHCNKIIRNTLHKSKKISKICGIKILITHRSLLPYSNRKHSLNFKGMKIWIYKK